MILWLTGGAVMIGVVAIIASFDAAGQTIWDRSARRGRTNTSAAIAGGDRSTE
jgi:hypothetical protein